MGFLICHRLLFGLQVLESGFKLMLGREHVGAGAKFMAHSPLTHFIYPPSLSSKLYKSLPFFILLVRPPERVRSRAASNGKVEKRIRERKFLEGG
jgi:hypothetical protein